MPTVMRIGGFRVVIYPADHRPSHVHVIGGDGEAVFHLNCPEGPVVLRENYGLGRRAVATLRKALDEAVSVLCGRWETIHG